MPRSAPARRRCSSTPRSSMAGWGLRDWAYARLKKLAAATLAVIALAFLVAVTVDLSAGLSEGGLRLVSWTLVLPIICVVAIGGVAASAHFRIDALPFTLTVVFFVSAFLALGLMMWPYMIPYSITVADAAAPDASLRFFFYGGVVVLPIIAVYTIGVYWVFRGKTDQTSTH